MLVNSVWRGWVCLLSTMVKNKRDLWFRCVQSVFLSLQPVCYVPLCVGGSPV